VNDRVVAVARAAAFVIAALLGCAVIVQIAGYSGIAMLGGIADGTFLAPNALAHTVRWCVPLFLTATGVVVAFRFGYFNIGAQGQLYLGAIGAAFIADRCAGLPPVLLVPLAIAAGIAGGALWALWPGWLRVASGTDEVITTLMGNFIAGLVLVYVTTGPLKDPSGTGQLAAGREIEAAYRLSVSSGVSPVLIALAVAGGAVVWWFLDRTAFGVLGTLNGRNPVMVAWQGASAARIGIAAFAISGGMAGLAGALEVLGPDGRLVSGFAPTIGFTAVLIALVGGLSIAGTAVAALFFGGLMASSLYLPVVAGLPAAAIDLINAAIALLVTARSWPRWLRLHRAAE
jgi:ABC-type uncharacterized transport system permease subunit